MADLFSDIIGHKEIRQALSAALTAAQVGQAYLFVGPVGVGKKTLARAWASRLLCIEQGADDCQCPSCSSWRRGSHPEFTTVSPIGNSIKIEQLREIQHQVYLRPLVGKRRVFFFPDAEQLTEAAANSFLKLLEEPPPGTVFLFTAVRPDQILATIRSRCQIYQLFPVALEIVQQWLCNRGLDPAEAKQRALECQGLPGLALDFSQTREETAGPPRLADLLDQDLLGILKFTAALEQPERRMVLELLRVWEREVRSTLLQLCQAEAPGLSRSRVAELVFTLGKLIQTLIMVESNVNLRLALEELLIAIKLRQDQPVTEGI